MDEYNFKMITKKQLEKEYTGLKRNPKWIKATWGIVNNYDVAEATLAQTNEIIKLVEPKLNELNKEIDEFEEDLE